MRLHERAHKCTQESCDYSTIGFPTQAGLTRHTELCHSAPSEEYGFPEGKRISLSNALKGAIDIDDAIAAREICMEMSVHPLKETGFLFHAVKRRSFDTAFVLLELLGSPELIYRSNSRRTVLHEAAEANHMGFLGKILCTRVNVNAVDASGRTPLSTALERNHFDAFRLLWSCTDYLSMRYTAVRNIWKKAIVETSSRGYNDLVRSIFVAFAEHCGYVSGPHSRMLCLVISQALVRAASNNQESTVDTILELGREWGVEKLYSVRLKKALYEEGIKGLKLLQQDPEIGIDNKGKPMDNALAQAALKGDEKTVRDILKRGAAINYGADLRYNALEAAAQKGNLSMIGLLLKHRADVNARSQYGRSALIEASEGGHIQAIQTLLDHGADVNTLHNIDDTALIRASERGHVHVVQTLLDHGADVESQDGYQGTALVRACKEGHMEVVQALLDHGVDVDAQSRHHGTALMNASDRGHVQVVQRLLGNGADVNGQGYFYGTYGSALKLALSKGHNEVVQTLLKHGAIADTEGQSLRNSIRTPKQGNLHRLEGGDVLENFDLDSP